MPDADVWANWLRTGRDGGSARMRADNLVAAALSSGEAERFTAHPSPALHEGRGERCHAMTFLRAWR